MTASTIMLFALQRIPTTAAIVRIRTPQVLAFTVHPTVDCRIFWQRSQNALDLDPTETASVETCSIPHDWHDDIMPLFCPTRQTASEKRYPANGFATVHGVVFGNLVYRPPKQPSATDRRPCVTGGSRLHADGQSTRQMSWKKWSEREDLNLRPLVSQTSALTGLRHAPNVVPLARIAALRKARSHHFGVHAERPRNCPQS